MSYLNKSFLPFVFVLGYLGVYAQEVDLKWSPSLTYDQKKVGAFESILGTNAELIYVKLGSGKLENEKDFDVSKIIAYDKQTMKEVKRASIFQKQQSRMPLSDLKNIHLLQAQFFDSYICLFWYTRKNDLISLYGQRFSNNLDRQIEIKLITSYNMKSNVKTNQEYYYGTPKILTNTDRPEEFLLLLDYRSPKVEFISIDSEFNKKEHVKVDLTESEFGASFHMDNSYRMEADGHVIVKCDLATFVDKIDNPKMIDRTHKHFVRHAFFRIDPSDGQKQWLLFDYENIRVLSFNYFIKPDGELKLFGVISDQDKNPNSFRANGIFYLKTKVNDFQRDKTPIITYFEEDMISEMYNIKTESSESSHFHITELEKSIFKIEQSFEEDNGKIVLFGTLVNRYFPTNAKRNITALQLDDAGKINWFSNRESKRMMKNVLGADIQVTSNDSHYFVTYLQYSSDKEFDDQINLLLKAQKGKPVKYTTEFASFRKSDGENKKMELTIDNGLYRSREERKAFYPGSFRFSGGDLYVHSLTQRRKLKRTIPIIFLGVATAGCGLVALSLPGNHIETGHLGRIIMKP